MDNPLGVAELSASEILSISVPERLYSGNLAEARSQYRRLASRWHPDHSTGVHEVFQHVKALFEQAEQKLKSGTWSLASKIVFRRVDGRQFQMLYKRHRKFELGDLYIGDGIVTYSVSKDNEDLYRNGIRAIKRLKFPDDAVRREVSPALPQIFAELETEDAFVVVFKKEPGLLLLRDVLDHLGGKIDQHHVAWILSCLYSHRCYLELIARTVHCDISPDTYFINPAQHSGSLLGGWWYAHDTDSALRALPQRTLELHSVKGSKPKAETKMMSDLIRATGRELLGDLHGSKLLMVPGLKPALRLWLQAGGSSDAIDDYRAWDRVLDESFGARKFVELNVSSKDIY